MIAAVTPTGTSPPLTPNDQIEALTGRRHLSWSQLSSYRGCPRRWFFSHVEGLEPDFVSSALILGSAVHAAVQHHYEQQLEGRTADHSQLQEVFQLAWTDESKDKPIRYGKDEDSQSLQALGSKMLEAFLASDLATPPGDLIAIEETLTGPIHPDLPDLVARLDVAWLNDDGLHLMDLKTSRSRWSSTKVQESSEQLLLYKQLASSLADHQPIHLHFGVISKAKSPSIQLLDIPHNPSKLPGVVSLMLPVWHAMKFGVDFASPNPISCASCGYRSKCPAH